MELINVVLIIATLLIALVAGFVLAFALVVMPGIATLPDKDYLQGFKAVDGVIQRGQPVFGVVWLGSAVAAIASAVLGFWYLEGLNLWLTVVACALYLLGVQLPTLAFNIPLNNRLQSQDLEKMSESELSDARKVFENPWMRWNLFRTVVAIGVSVILLYVLLRIDA